MLFTGEIETAHPGYLGSQDTFYVGTIKGVGRIYQQTFVDTASLFKVLTTISVIRSRSKCEPVVSISTKAKTGELLALFFIGLRNICSEKTSKFSELLFAIGCLNANVKPRIKTTRKPG